MGSEFPDWVVKEQSPGRPKAMIFVKKSPDISKMPAWMKRCISYWDANGPKDRGLCNEIGFCGKGRHLGAKYGDKMDASGHHWGPGKLTSEGARLRERDFDEYMEQCEKLNKSDPPPWARTKKKRRKRTKKRPKKSKKRPKKSKKSKKHAKKHAKKSKKRSRQR